MDMNDGGWWSGDPLGERPSEGDRLSDMLEARARAVRCCDGLTQRVFQASAPLIGRHGLVARSESGARAWSWGAGLAAAASIVLALFVGVSTQTARLGVDMTLADRVGGESEPVLVALLAGSEVVEQESPSASELLAAQAMPILRSRDASFSDLDSEVRLVVAGGGDR